MKCKDCDCCHLASRTRWSPQKQCMQEVEIYECWGVKEPFEIDNIYRECTEYPEKRDMKLECDVCSGDYHQWIQSYIFRFHHSNEITADKIETKFCPNCGRNLGGGEVNA